MRPHSFSLLARAAMTVGLFGAMLAPLASADGIPLGTPLGTAASYAVIAQTLVSNPTTFGDTVITGNLGVSPSGSCTGFIPAACGAAAAGTITGVVNINNGASAGALADAGTAKGALLATVIPAPTDLTGGVLGVGSDATLPPGIYTFSTTAQLNGILTLDGGSNLSPVWIFEIGTSLTTGTGSSVVVTGAGAAGVYWVEGTTVTLGTNTEFEGNIFAGTTIAFDPGAQDTCGRAFSDTAVTFAGDNPAAAGGQPNIVSDTCGQSASGFNGEGPVGGATPEPGTLGLALAGFFSIFIFPALRRH